MSSSANTVQVSQSLLSAFHTYGFLYVTDYSKVIPTSLVESVFRHGANFFAHPQSEKDGLEWTTARSNRGYVKMGREKVSLGKTKEEVARERDAGGDDLKESFEIGREGEEGHPNRWPDPLDKRDVEFRQTMEEFFLKCKKMHAVLMRGIALGLGLEGDFFDEYVKMGDNTLRLLHYPAAHPEDFENGRRVRAGAHSDYGSITLLFQDQRGGLQVEKPDRSGWLYVEPREGTIVVNAGDLLARWSNDLIRSTMHRVVQPPLKGQEKVDGHPPRYSVAYFCNPDFDKWIEVLPGTWEENKDGKKYGGINSGDYLAQRLEATY